MPGTFTVSPTGNQSIDGLLTGVRWSVTTPLTYSFPTSVSFYGTVHGTIPNFEPLNFTQQLAVGSILSSFSSVANVSFSLVTETATFHGALRFGMSDKPATAFAYYPYFDEIGGDSFYNNSSGQYDNPVRGNYGWYTFVHEIGHAMGLKHPHETDVYGASPFGRDSVEFSIMSYRSYIGASTTGGLTNETWGHAQTLMMDDIAALQYMYGANYSFNATATVYQWSPTTGAMSINGVSQAAPGGNRIFATVWDGGGNDTYDFSNYSTGVTVDLRPGEWTTTSAVQLANLGNGNFARGNIANALMFNNDKGSLIENAIGGAGNDTLIGNVVANTLDGGGGSDTVHLAGLVTDYTFSGTLLSFTANGLGAIDTLLNVEFVRFLGSGTTVAVSTLVTAGAADDYRDTITDTTAPLGTITVGATRQGNIETNGDTDVFSISLVAGQVYTFTARGSASGGGTLVDPVLELRNSAGTLLLTNDDFGGTNDSQITYTATATGTFYLVADGFGTGTGTYTIGATTSASGDDYRDSIADTTAPLGTVTVGGTVQGNIETNGDSDVFSVSLIAGQVYTFAARGTVSGGGTLADPVLELRNSAGTLLAFNDDFNGTYDSRITFTATATGTFYLIADGYGSGTGTYTLSAATTAPADDYRDSITDTTAPLGTILVGSTGQGSIETNGDSDVFSILLVAGQSYTFAARGSASGGGTLVDPILELRNSAGTLLAFNDDSNGTTDSLFTYTATSTGTFYLVADGFGTGTGTYTVSAASNDDFRDSITDTTAPLGTITVGGTRQGNIEASGDSDVFSITLVAGQVYTFTARGLDGGGGTLDDPILELRSSAGTLLAFNDDSNGTYDSLITYTATATGTFYLVADGYGVSDGTYTLTASSSSSTAADVRNDFNGDGRSDILWRNQSGALSDWLGTASGGFTGNDANAFAMVPTNWQVGVTGDFNGDGRDDILWRNEITGQLSNWLGQANGGFVNNDANALTSVPTNWLVVGAGDFNGDGRDDILWRSNSGQLSNWLGQANGGFVGNDANAFTVVPTNWNVVGTGDFNGDGRDDILWRSDAGQLSNWLGQANGGFVGNDANAFTTVGTNWSVAGVGDFNGDGRDDILWRSNTGQLSNWLGTASGGFVGNDANAFTTVATNWSVAGVGDYNGDGRDDILWRSSTGQLSNWLGTANGGFVGNDANAFAAVPTSWFIEPGPPELV